MVPSAVFVKAASRVFEPPVMRTVPLFVSPAPSRLTVTPSSSSVASGLVMVMASSVKMPSSCVTVYAPVRPRTADSPDTSGTFAPAHFADSFHVPLTGFNHAIDWAFAGKQTVRPTEAATNAVRQTGMRKPSHEPTKREAQAHAPERRARTPSPALQS